MFGRFLENSQNSEISQWLRVADFLARTSQFVKVAPETAAELATTITVTCLNGINEVFGRNVFEICETTIADDPIRDLLKLPDVLVDSRNHQRDLYRETIEHVVQTRIAAANRAPRAEIDLATHLARNCFSRPATDTDEESQPNHAEPFLHMVAEAVAKWAPHDPATAAQSIWLGLADANAMRGISGLDILWTPVMLSAYDDRANGSILKVLLEPFANQYEYLFEGASIVTRDERISTVVSLLESLGKLFADTDPPLFSIESVSDPELSQFASEVQGWDLERAVLKVDSSAAYALFVILATIAECGDSVTAGAALPAGGLSDAPFSATIACRIPTGQRPSARASDRELEEWNLDETYKGLARDWRNGALSFTFGASAACDTH
jgi:hypothetical protein